MSYLEHVTDSGTRDRGHLTATHPRPEAELDVLAAPNLQTLVERSDLEEIVFLNGNGASNERW